MLCLLHHKEVSLEFSLRGYKLTNGIQSKAKHLLSRKMKRKKSFGNFRPRWLCKSHYNVLYGATSARLSVVNNIIDHAKALEGFVHLLDVTFGFNDASGTISFKELASDELNACITDTRLGKDILMVKVSTRTL